MTVAGAQDAVNPTSRAYWETIADAWEASAPHPLWREHSDAVNVELLSRWLPDAMDAVLKTDLFDEAFGSGLVDFLSRRADRVFGVDIARNVVRRAASRFPALHAASCDVRELPFAAGSFDAIVSNSTLDHFDHPGDIRASLYGLLRVLKPGGRLILTLDNRRHPVIALRAAVPHELLRLLGLVPYFTGATLGPEDLRAQLQAVGFEVRALDAVLHCPRVLAVGAARVLQRARPALTGRFLGLLRGLERLRALPSRYLTGHFVCALAERPRKGVRT